MIVALTGYRASGKTSVARVLVADYGWSMIDTDAAILEHTGAPDIATIFAEQGEAGFRRAEAEAVRAAAERAAAAAAPERPVVLSLGGGALTETPGNGETLRAAGAVVVYLRCRAETLAARLAADAATQTQRPGLTADSAVDEVGAVLSRREPLYRAAADHVIDADDLPSETIAARIAGLRAEQP